MTKPLSSLDATAKILAEIEAERIEALSEEELREEMLDAGLDPDRRIDVDRWMAAALASARPDAPAPARANATTADAASAPAKPNEEAASTPAKPAPVFALPDRRRAAVWIGAVAACVLGIFIIRSALPHDGGASTEVAHRDAGPAPTTSGSAEGPSVLVRAAELRKDAEHACNFARWKTCEQRLDAAKALDPAGENEERVGQMREWIGQAKYEETHDAAFRAKP